MAVLHDDEAAGGPWPAFADLLGATTLLFLILFAAVAVPAMRRAGAADARDNTLDTLEQKLRGTGDGREVEVLRVGDYLLVRIRGDATFRKDRYALSDLKSEGKQILRELGASLHRDGLLSLIDQVQVVGHTSSEGSEERNWILSASRAATVSLFLIDSVRIDPCQVSALGRSRYYPVDPVAARTSSGANAEDRRIELEIRPMVVDDTVQKRRRRNCVGGRRGP
ncbi:OmpA/MotB family protein [Longimicrobium sp.]|uniref:OmpA/MotB family protein n=1 Tax=Longimicrobium sp. TaxID=2029185 RepID=UPI003B3A9DDA